MESESNFTVKEFLWSQKFPLDPAGGMTLFATVLEDDAGRRLFVYADPKRKPEAFAPDGTAVDLEMASFATKGPYEPQGQLIQIGGAALRHAAAPSMTAVAAGVRICTKYIGGYPIQVTCPPYSC